MAPLYGYCIRHPKSVICIAVLMTLGVAPGTLRLRMRTDGHALVPAHDPAILQDQRIRSEFGVEDPIIVLIRSDHEDGLFNPHTLALVQELTTDIQQMDGIHAWNVLSLAVEKGDRVRPGTLIFRRFLEPLPTTRQELERLRDDLRAIELYNGVLVSHDETATAIFVGVPAGADRTALYHALRDLIASKGDLPEEIHVLGAPVAEALLGTHILEDLGVPSAVLGQRRAATERATGRSLPHSLYEFRTLIGHHVGLVPIALSVMAIVFLLSFRSLSAVIHPLFEVGACLVFVFGVMGWCGVPVYLTIAVLPVILTAIGVADEIHIFARYQEQLRTQVRRDHVALLKDTMNEMWVPVVKTSITTAVGFLSFAISPIGPVRAFGVFTAVGIIFCMVWSLTVIPAALVLTDPKRFAGRAVAVEAPQAPPPSIFGRLGAAMIRYRFAVVLITLGVVVVAPFGVRRIVVQDSWIDGFAPDSEFYQATRYFNEQFLGMHTLLICADAGRGTPLTGRLGPKALGHHEVRIGADAVDAEDELVGYVIYLRRSGFPGATPSARRVRYTWDSRVESVARAEDAIILTTARRDGSPQLALRLKPGEFATYEIRPEWFMRPEVVNRIGRLKRFIEQHRDEEVGGVLSTADYIATTEFMIRGRRAGARRVPEQRDKMEWVWGQYKNVRGKERWKQAVTEDYTKALISVYMKNANFVGTKRLMEDIRNYEKEHLAEHGLSLSFAGDVAVSQTLISAIVTTQVRSLIGSLVGIFLVTALLGRSLVWGFLCVFPCAVAVLVNFAVMGFSGMPLGVATSMFAGMTLGIGVDYAIHLMERYRLSRAADLDLEAALIDAVQATGPAIAIDALAVALGFGVLTLSQVPANARLGGLVVLSIAGCFAATLLLLPAMIRLVRRRAHQRG